MCVDPVVVLTGEVEHNQPLRDRLTQARVACRDYPCAASRLRVYRGEALCRGQVLEEFAAVVVTDKDGVVALTPVADRLAHRRPLLLCPNPGLALDMKRSLGMTPDVIPYSEMREYLRQALPTGSSTRVRRVGRGRSAGRSNAERSIAPRRISILPITGDRTLCPGYGAVVSGGRGNRRVYLGSVGTAFFQNQRRTEGFVDLHRRRTGDREIS
jgi:hypothetical protein